MVEKIAESTDREVRLAFDHPEARAAEGEHGPHDRISLRDYLTEVEIGAFQQERGQTQRLRFNVVVEVRHEAEPITDDVDRILSYDRVTEAIEHELGEERMNLLETLAERIAFRILAEPLAERAFVRIEKLDRGPFALGVEIVRAKGDLPRAAFEGEAPHPLVLHLSNAAIGSAKLPGWLDQLQAETRPVILCVGLPEGPVPAAAHPLAQRRIDLLAMEQNAWVLAGRDPRCVVVDSRTELDWAMKHGRISVWAPSKIVLDATGNRPEGWSGAKLTRWFAEQMEAAAVLDLDATTPTELSL